MRTRTLARQMALQILYQVDVTHDQIEPVLEVFYRTRSPETTVRSFTELIVRGALEHLPTIDLAIQSASENWNLERMPVIDRCILRAATYELLYLLDISPAIAINEAVELAKTYSTDDSPAFVNAVLDKLKGRGPELVPITEMRTSDILDENTEGTALSSWRVP